MKLRILSQKHACGGCTACCDVMAAHELRKPFYARCEHLAENGCGIYADRPQSCREFVCVWSTGFMGEAPQWRPDRCGLLFFLRRFADGLWLEIYETHPGAAADPQRLDYLTDRMLARVARIEPVIGTRLHRHRDKIGLAFKADEAKYPSGAGVGEKLNRYLWVGGDAKKQVFLECHGNGAAVGSRQ